MRYLILLLLTSSCSIMQFTGNPEPDLKSVHMAMVHGTYTQSEYDAHPDYDCTIFKSNTNESNNRKQQCRQ